MNILEAIDDSNLLGASIRNPASWRPWRGLLAAAFGLGMDAEAAALFRACTGRVALPTAPFSFLWLCIGRRGGKSFAMSILAVYLACFKDWRPFLSPGERAVVLLVAADREQAKILIRYINGILAAPIMQTMVVGTTADTIELRGSVVIEVVTRSYRAVRGRSVAISILDELAFWRTDLDSSDPDIDVVNAIRASMATFGKDGMMVGASSPSGRRGVLWDAFARWYGTEDAANLVWRASTATMNPTVTKEFLDSEFERMDPASYNSEYLAEFRSDIGAFISRERVEQVVIRGRCELSPLANIHYLGFVDASGGSASSMACAVAYRNHDGKVVLSATREITAPFSPDAATQDFASFLKRYGIQKVIGDSFGGQYPAERFRAYGIQYQPSEKSKNDIYRDFLPLVNSEQVELLDDGVLINQLCSLERNVSRTGQETIAPPKDRRDDVINAAAGAIVHVGYEHAPRIMRYEDFLRGGEPVEEPMHACYSTFVSMACDNEGRAAVIGWKVNEHMNPALILCDFRCSYFTDHGFADYTDPLALCYKSCSQGTKTAAIVPILYPLDATDVIKSFEFAPKVAAVVAAGRVRLSKAAHEQSRTAPIGSALDFKIEKLSDPLAAASLAGIFMGLVGNKYDLM